MTDGNKIAVSAALSAGLVAVVALLGDSAGMVGEVVLLPGAILNLMLHGVHGDWRISGAVLLYGAPFVTWFYASYFLFSVVRKTHS